MANGPVIANAKVVIIPSMEGSRSAIINSIGSAAQTAGAQGGTKLGNAMSSGITSTLSTAKVAIGNVIGNIVTQGMSYVSGMVNRAVTRLDIIENYPKIMTNIGYSTDDAQRSIDKMVESLDGLPTATDDLVRFTQRLTTATRDIEKSTAAAIGFNDMLLSSPTDAVLQKNAMEQFAQMLAVGKVDMMAWKSVVNAMPAAMDQLAQALLGPTANALELYDALGGNKHEQIISFDEVLDKIIELDTVGGDGIRAFSQQAGVASESVGTALKNVQNRTAKALQVIMKAIGQVTISKTIDKMSYSVANAGVRIADFITRVKNGDTEFAEPLKRTWNAIKSIASLLSGALKKGFDENKDAIKNLVLDGVKRLADSLEFIKKTIEDVLGRLDSLRGGFSDFMGRLEGFKPTIDAVMGSLKSNATKVINSLAGAFNTLRNSLGDKIFSSMDMLQTDAAGLGGSFRRLVDLIGDNLSGAIKWIGENAPKVLSPVLDFVVFVGRAGFSAMFDIIAAIVDMLSKVAGAISGGFPEGVDAFEEFHGALNDVAKAMEDFIIQARDKLVDAIKWIGDNAPEMVSKISDGISNALGILDDLRSSFSDVLQSDQFELAKQMLFQFGERAEKVFSGIGGEIKDFLDSLFSGFSSKLESFDPTSTAVNAITNVLDFLNGALEGIQWIWQGVKAIFESLGGLFDALAKKSGGDLGGKLGDLFSSIGHALESVVGALFPKVVKIITSVIDAITSFVSQGEGDLGGFIDSIAGVFDWIAGHGTLVADTILAFAGGFGVFKAGSKAIDLVIGGMKKLKKGIAAVNIAGPIKRFKKEAKGIQKEIKALKKSLTKTFTSFSKSAKKIFGIVKKAVLPSIDFVKKAFDVVKRGGSAIISWFKKDAKLWVEIIKGAFDWFLDIIKALPGQIKTHLVEFVSEDLPGIAATLKEKFQLWGEIIQGGLDWIVDEIKSLPGLIKSHLDDIVSKAGGFLGGIKGKIAEFFAEVAGKIGEFIASAKLAFSDLGTHIGSVVGDIKNHFVSMKDKLGETIDGIKAKIDEYIAKVNDANAAKFSPNVNPSTGTGGGKDGGMPDLGLKFDITSLLAGGAGGAAAAGGGGGILASLGTIAAVAAAVIAAVAVILGLLDQIFKLLGQTEGIMPNLQGAWEVLCGVVDTVAGFVHGIITGDWGPFNDGIQRIIDGSLAQMAATFNELLLFWESLVHFVAWVVSEDGPLAPFIRLFNDVKGIIGDVLDLLGTVGINVLDGISGILGAIGGFIYGIITGDWGPLFEALDHIKNAVKNIWDKLGEFFGKIPEKIGEIVGDLGGIIQWFNDLPGKVWEAIKSIPDVFANVFSGIFDNIHLPQFGLDWSNASLIPGTDFRLPRIKLFAKGGLVNNPTLSLTGEAGPELITPLSSPYVRRYASMIAGMIGMNGQQGSGDTYFIIDGATVNADDEIERKFYDVMLDLKRLGVMNRGCARNPIV